jgi:hypothetical protein
MSDYIDSNQFILDIRGFQHSRMGWIHDGKLIPCSLHDHFSILAQDRKYSSLVTVMNELVEQANIDEQIMLEGVGPDDHVPWHAYQSDSQDAIPLLRSHILNTAYSDGWIRIGCFPSQLVHIHSGAYKKIGNKKGKSKFALEVETTTLSKENEIFIDNIAYAIDSPYVFSQISMRACPVVRFIKNCITALERQKFILLLNFGLFQYSEVSREVFDAHVGIKWRNEKRNVIFTTTPWGTEPDYNYLSLYCNLL